MKRYLVVLLFTFCIVSCKGQSNTQVERNVGGPCEDCEALLDYKTINTTPKSIDTIPGFAKNNPDRKSVV